VWRVFAANAVVMVGATVLLLATPVTIHSSIRDDELVAVLAALAVALAVDLVLLRYTLAPLRRFAKVMTDVDPMHPGQRVGVVERAGSEVVAVAEAFDAMLDRLETERRESARRALSAQEGERLRVARELHDEVGQTLTAVALRAERAAAGSPDGDRAYDEIAATLQQSLDEVRRIARELRPEALDDLGLVNALIALCSRVERQGELRIEHDLPGHLPPLGPEADLVVYRIAQEALTNALRHARASRVDVTLAARGERVVLTVRDDGRGLPDPLGPTVGLAGMRERALLVDAELDVRSEPGAGVTVTLAVPVA